MKYLTFVWSVCLAGVLYLPLMLVIWFVTGSFPPWWVAFGVIALIAFGVHLVILVRQDSEWKSEDVLRPDEAVQANVEDMIKRRQEAENYILQSGDEEAVKILQQARGNFYCYNTILYKGMEKGNDTLKIALVILSGMFGDKDPTEIREGDLAEAMKSLESKLVPMNVKNQR